MPDDQPEIEKPFVPPPDMPKPLPEDERPPLFEDSVAAGFPSPARDSIDHGLDLNQLLVPHPNATYFVRACGDSMINAGIYDGDILVVDKSLTPRQNDIVIAEWGGEFTVKYIDLSQDPIRLVPANPAFPVLIPAPEETIELFGVVTANIHKPGVQ